MSNPPYPSNSAPSSHEPSLEPPSEIKYAELGRTVQDIRVENTRLNSDVQQLRGRTASLIGLVIGLIWICLVSN